MKNIIERIVKFCIYATFFVPLVVVPSSFIFPFIVPKILLFRALVTIMLAGYILLLAVDFESYRPIRSILSLSVLLFLLSFGLSTFLGVDAYHSFWDNHERMLGLFTITHYIIYFFICGAVLRSWSDWKWALRLFLLAGSIVMFIAVLQKGNPELLLNQGSDRTASTLGNAIYVGGYGLFLFFVSLLLFTKDKITSWRFAYGLAGILAILGIFFSGTRGSVIGLLAGLFVTIVGYLIIIKNHARVRYSLLGILGLVVFGVLVLYANRNSAWVESLPAIGRLSATSFSDIKNGTRFIAWQIAWQSAAEKPFFGWGPNNFFYAFNKYYNPRSLEFGYGETWFDNAHNIILNTLTVQGWFGLIVYLSVFGVAGVVLWRNKNFRESQPHVVVIGSAFLFAHLVQNITVFENPTSYLYFMFWLALVAQSTTAVVKSDENNIQKIKTAAASQPVGIGAVVLTGLAALAVIFVFEIQPARANIKTLDALNAFATDPTTGFAVMQETLKFNSPHIDDIRSDLARMVVDLVGRYYQKLGKEQSVQFIDFTRTSLEENVKLHPLDIRNNMTLTQLNQLSYAITNDPRFIVSAHEYLVDALSKSPRRQQLMYMLASIKLQLGRKDEAIRLMEQSIEEDQKISEGYWRLAFIYQFIGDTIRARATLGLAHERGVVFDAQGQDVETQIMAGLGKNGTKK